MTDILYCSVTAVIVDAHHHWNAVIAPPLKPFLRFLRELEQRALEASLHKNAFAAVASLIQRKRAVVAIRESARLGRNKDAWSRSGTSPFCIGVRVTEPELGVTRLAVVLPKK